MTDEMKALIEDAAQLVGATVVAWEGSTPVAARIVGEETHLFGFNPCDPERGDLMKVADAAGLSLRFGKSEVTIAEEDGGYVIFTFTKGDHDSKVFAILRAASAVLHSRGGV